MKENEDKSTTGFVSLQNENEDHNTSVHKDDDEDGKWKGSYLGLMVWIEMYVLH